MIHIYLYIYDMGFSSGSGVNAGDAGSIPGLGRSLEKGMTAYSSILAWRIPWTKEPGRPQSMGLQRVRHDWATNTFTFFPQVVYWGPAMCLCYAILTKWWCQNSNSRLFAQEPGIFPLQNRPLFPQRWGLGWLLPVVLVIVALPQDCSHVMGGGFLPIPCCLIPVKSLPPFCPISVLTELLTQMTASWLTIFFFFFFCLFILFMGFSRKKYRSGLPFHSLVDHILSELSTMTYLSWVALHGIAQSFIELDKAVVHEISLISFLWLCQQRSL